MKPGFERLKRRIDIGEVIEELSGADVPRRGNGWQTMTCPFHEDRVKSASVNLTKGRFKCHACGIDGDSIDLVMELNDQSFSQAVEWLTAKI